MIKGGIGDLGTGLIRLGDIATISMATKRLLFLKAASTALMPLHWQ